MQIMSTTDYHQIIAEGAETAETNSYICRARGGRVAEVHAFTELHAKLAFEQELNVTCETAQLIRVG